jgi:hypothetical protein
VDPAVHPATHAPIEHTVPAGHVASHAPQFAGSFNRSVHPEAQRVSSVGHGATAVHSPATQPCPAAHAWPHDPQFAVLPDSVTHVEPQSVWPLGQRSQIPSTHRPGLHTAPQAPQCDRLVRRSTQQPH